MKKNIVIIIIFSISSAVIVASFLYFGKHDISREVAGKKHQNIVDEEKFSADFDGVNIEKIVSDSGAEYEVINGNIFRGESRMDFSDVEPQVVNLAYFGEWMREDPLFFATTLDTERFRVSINELKKQEDSFLINENLKGRIFPTDFLVAFADASDAYGVFQKNISMQAAEDLREKIDKAIAEYEKDAQNLKETIDSLGLDGAKARFAGLAGDNYTNVDIVSSDLGKVIVNADMAKSELEERRKCLLGDNSSCKLPLKNMQIPQKNENQQQGESVSDPALLSFEQLGMDKGKSYPGPFAIKSSCWRGRIVQHVYPNVTCRPESGLCMENSILATDAYSLIKLNEKVPSEKKLLDLGVRAVPESATASYVCSDLEYKPRLLTISHVYGEYKKNPPLATARLDLTVFSPDEKADIDEAMKIEKEFFSAKYPSEEKFDKMLAWYAYIWSRSGKWPDDARKNTDKLLEIYSQGNEKFADIDLAFNNIIFYFSHLAVKRPFLRSQEGQGGVSLYIYPVRSAYSLMYLGFSPTIWRTQEKMKFLDVDPEMGKDKNRSMVTREEAAAVFGEEKLIEWQKIAKSFNRTLMDMEAIQGL